MGEPFAAIIHTDDAGGFSAWFPDAPGCFAAGETLARLKADAASALRAHIDVSSEEGLSIPKARPLDEVLSDPAVALEREDAYAVLEIRPLARSGKVRRINLTADEFALSRIDRAATRRGMTRSAFMVGAALEAAEDGTGETG